MGIKSLIRSLFNIGINTDTDIENAQPFRDDEITYINNNAQYIKFPNIHYKFDIDKMRFYMHGRHRIYEGSVEADFYFIPPMYRYEMKGYIVIVNAMLHEVAKKYDLNIQAFDFTNLKFERNNDLYNDFCMFFYHPFDYYGEISNMPFSITLCFDNSSSFIDLYFDNCFNPYGARIVCWAQKKCYSFRAGALNGLFQITSAYLKTNGNKVRIFDIGYEKYKTRKLEYEWICDNLPDLAPKTLGGYTRMKHSKSKNYLKIKEQAAQSGLTLLDDI